SPGLHAVRRVAAAIHRRAPGDLRPPAFAHRKHGPTDGRGAGARLAADLRGAGLAHPHSGARDPPHPLGDGDLLYLRLRRRHAMVLRLAAWSALRDSVAIPWRSQACHAQPARRVGPSDEWLPGPTLEPLGHQWLGDPDPGACVPPLDRPARAPGPR